MEGWCGEWSEGGEEGGGGGGGGEVRRYIGGKVEGEGRYMYISSEGVSYLLDAESIRTIWL